ncbi:MAG: type II toxin-antitoxin system RelE/ParE family toxin [Pseudomonadota bacterium]
MPVRDWLLTLSPEDRKAVGDDIRTAEFGWPIGMPLCRPMQSHKGLWEVRTNLTSKRIARVLFCAHKGEMILLHGFVKKSQKTPQPDLDLAMKRMRGLT